MEDLIARYGLFAIGLGAGVEGEPFALAGGVLAHRHWLPLHGAMLAAITGSCLVDQFWFHLARHVRHGRMVRSIVTRPAFQRSLALIERHPVVFILLFRFAYGLRAITAVAVGASRMPTRQFVLLNIVAASVWGVGFTWLGYRAGPVLDAVQMRYGMGMTLASVGVAVVIAVLLVRATGR